MGEENASIPWIRAAKLNKILTVCLIGAMACIGALSISMSTLFPLKTTELMILEMKSEDENFVVLHRAGENLRANMPLVGKFLRAYVVDREKVDKVTEQVRYRQVAAMSSKAVKKNFRTFVEDKKISPYLRPNLKRRIENVRDVPIAKGIHKITFERVDTYDHRPGQDPKVTSWEAVIHYKFLDQKVQYSKTRMNPLGLFVIEYTLTPNN